MRLAVFLLRQIFGDSGAKDAVKQRQAPILDSLRHGLGEGAANKFLHLSADELRKARIDIRHDMGRPIHGDHRLG